MVKEKDKMVEVKEAVAKEVGEKARKARVRKEKEKEKMEERAKVRERMDPGNARKLLTKLPSP